MLLLSQFDIAGHSGPVPPPQLTGPPPPIRAVCLSPNMKRLAVGTQACEVIEFIRNDTEKDFSQPGSGDPRSVGLLVSGRQLVTGHFKGELWGLAVRPFRQPKPDGSSQSEYCTVSTR